MVVLKDILPKAKSSVNTNDDHSNDPWFKSRYSLSEADNVETFKAKPVPPYLKQAGFHFKPSKPENFGDGRGIPEIHYAQYPLGMGRSTGQKPSGKPLTVDDIVRQNENAKKIVNSQHSDLVPTVVKDNDEIQITSEMVRV
ncbi:SNW/SKI-interacting protein A-like [Henckelia pumila]|uniref:SNW/SKI-interacting protein A-like n=1 Tax=Henckelia pumila TaxID=405737 RepID=UPI003C6DC604